MAVHGGLGHNSGRQHWTHDRDAAFGVAIEQYVGNARVDEALLREELLKLDSGARMVLLRNTVLLGMVRYIRSNPKADCTLAVYNLVAWLSDNDRGYCWLSQRRIGEILGRSEDTVRVAFRRLYSGRLIDKKDGNGENNISWPIMPNILQEAPPGLMWMVSRFSTGSHQRRAQVTPGQQTPMVKPAKTPLVHKGGSPETPLKEPGKPPLRTMGYTPKGNLLKDDHKNKQRDSAHESSILDSEPNIHDNRARVFSFKPTEAQKQLFHMLWCDWGYRSGKSLNPAERSFTDSNLINSLEIYSCGDAAVAAPALHDVLTRAAAAHAAHQSGEDSDARPVKGKFASWFQTAIRRKLKELQLEQHELLTKAAEATEISKVKVAKEQLIAKQGTEAHQKRIEQGHARAAAEPRAGASGQRRPGNPYSEDGRRFKPDFWFRKIIDVMLRGSDANAIMDAHPQITVAMMEKAHARIEDYHLVSQSASSIKEYWKRRAMEEAGLVPREPTREEKKAAFEVSQRGRVQ